ncbi:MAG: type I methionyl aminopeptidase [Epsilonproteobacteria bacterium]|nr:type I methionyl aminopeptidase [Campylobacterota bacterium]
MAIPIRKQKEIEMIKKPAQLVAKALELAREMAVVGATGIEIDKEVEDFIVKNGGRPSFKGLYGFPNSVCVSKNEVIIHGIPDNIPFKEGDIVGFDIGVEIDGWYGDAAITVPIGTVDEISQKLIDVSRDTLYKMIENIKVGMRFKQLSKIAQDYITSHGFYPLQNYCGHGIGRSPHEDPQILNYVEGKINQGDKIKNGMVFCLEPMICQDTGESEVLEDGWSVVNATRKRGSHYEHQIAIVENKPIILTEL